MSSTQTEKLFVSTYLQLINLSNNSKADEFNSTSEYYKIDSLGPTLPKINVTLPKASSEEDQGRTITVKIKTIKPPYKFSTELKNVRSSTSILKLKSDLIQSVPILSEAGITPDSIKLLIKGKVSSDTLHLDSISDDEEISFMAMITAPSSSPAPNPSPVQPVNNASVPQTTEIKNSEIITDATWNKIHALIKQDVTNEQTVNDYIMKFKNSLN